MVDIKTKEIDNIEEGCTDIIVYQVQRNKEYIPMYFGEAEFAHLKNMLITTRWNNNLIIKNAVNILESLTEIGLHNVGRPMTKEEIFHKSLHWHREPLNRREPSEKERLLAHKRRIIYSKLLLIEQHQDRMKLLISLMPICMEMDSIHIGG
jgi:hypothetical protein